MIFPDLVFGSPGAFWIKSGFAIAPISFATNCFNSLLRSSENDSSIIRVTKAYIP